MKQKINIYTNIKKHKFFNQITPEYTFDFRPINELSYNSIFKDDGGIIINKNTDEIGVDLSVLKKNYIVLTCDKKLNRLKNNIRIMKVPLFPYQLKSNIENFLFNHYLQIGHLLIFDQKIQNLKNSKNCPLTDIENKILVYLINNKYCTKEYIKENVLNIKSTIQTNSVETHLTRIRKKLDALDSNFKIKSKNNIISTEIS